MIAMRIKPLHKYSGRKNLAQQNFAHFSCVNLNSKLGWKKKSKKKSILKYLLIGYWMKIFEIFLKN